MYKGWGYSAVVGVVEIAAVGYTLSHHFDRRHLTAAEHTCFKICTVLKLNAFYNL